MISQVAGVLVSVGETSVMLRVGPLVIEVLMAASELDALRTSSAVAGAGVEMAFHTSFYLEGDASGGNLTPRLVGFARERDLEFFQKFITVKGIGPKKALKSLALPVATIARSIENKDAKSLTRLPQIGTRLAEQIIAELSGKVSMFAADFPGDAAGSPVPQRATASDGPQLLPAEEDAVAGMVALGERRADAIQLLARARQLGVTDTTGLLRAMLNLRAVSGAGSR